MAESIDLHILPIYRQNGVDQSYLPGLHLAQRPRHIVRGRENDQLILYMSLADGSVFTVPESENLYEDLTRTYYKSSGSVTTAMRQVANRLNQILLERNQEYATGRPLVAMLVQLVRRGEQYYLAQSGGVFSVHIHADGLEALYDPEIVSQGLGLNKTVSVRFFSVNLQSDDTLLLSSQPAADWRADTMSSLHGQGPESARRRLVATKAAELNAVIIQAKPGKGILYLLQAPVMPQPEPIMPTPVPEPEPASLVVQELPPLIADIVEEPDEQPLIETVVPEPVEQNDTPVVILQGEEPGFDEGVPVHDEPADLPKANPVSNLFLRLGAVLSRVVERIFPEETLASIPNTTMAIIALVVPVIVVTVASVVYIQRGLQAQSQDIYKLALEAARRAESEVDILARRAAWLEAVDLLANEEYFTSPTVNDLRAQAQKALDEIDLVRRLNFQNAVSGLPPGTQVRQMELIGEDLYLLDGASGEVLRAAPTNQGYAIDTSFSCRPGMLGTDLPFVGFIPWEVEQLKLMAVNPEGGVVFCGPGQEPVVDRLASPPERDFGSLAGVTQGLGDLYVLDKSGNAVWVYPQSAITQPPSYFFEEGAPSVDNVVDLTFSNQDLYLLHVDGKVTLCQESGYPGTPTRCVGPLDYIDQRPGREDQPMVLDSPFTQILYSPPPDPSLYLLDAQNGAVYHFSLRNMVFQRQFAALADSSPRSPVSAFMVDTVDRTIYLAFGDSIYYARVP